MKAFSLSLLAATALNLSLTSCDAPDSKKATTQLSKTAATTADTASATSTDGSAPATAKATTVAPAAAQANAVAVPAGLKVGRWQAFLLAQRHATHFVLEVAVENNKAVCYLLNAGPAGQQRLRCGEVRAIGDSAIIGLPGTDATLAVRANGDEHLAGAWVQPGGKTPSRTAFSAIYGEQSPLRLKASTPNFAGTWRVSFKRKKGQARPAVLVVEQQGPKLLSSLTGPGGSFNYLSGAALPDGMGISSFDGHNAILLQAQKLPNGTLQGDFYSGKSTHETWTAAPVSPATGTKE